MPTPIGKKVTEQERDKLVELTDIAENTPVIALTIKDGLEGRDFATLAWNNVRDYMNELAQKYGYDSETHAINHKTCEIVSL